MVFFPTFEMGQQMNGSAPKRDDSEVDFAALKVQQELKNLQVAEEKTRQELLDLHRPYLLRNPQLLTALITTLGAIIGISILVSDNYFKAREQLNKLTEEKTARIKQEAEAAIADSRTKQREAAEASANAAKQTADARQQVAAAETRIADAIRRRSIAEQNVVQAERQRAIIQRRFFASQGLPESLASNIDHVLKIDIDHAVKDLSWLPKGLKELHITMGELVNVDNILRDIPRSVQRLSLSSADSRAEFNLKQLPKGIISLSLDHFTVDGIVQMQHLEELSMESSGGEFIRGLEEMRWTPLKRIFLSIDSTSPGFPEELADRVRRLELNEARHEETSNIEIIKRMGNVEKLVLHGSNYLPLAVNFPNLKSLVYYDSLFEPKVVRDDLLNAIPKSETLTDLHIFAEHYAVSRYATSQFANVKTLEIGAFDDSFLELLLLFPAADLTINLHVGPRFNRNDFDTLIFSLRQMPKLKKLMLDILSYDFNGDVPVTGFDNLEELEVRREVRPINGAAINKLHGLKKLTLVGDVTGLDITNLEQLEELNLYLAAPPHCSRALKGLKSFTMVSDRDFSKCKDWQRFFDQVVSGMHLHSLGISGQGCQLSSIPATVDQIVVRNHPDNILP